MSKQTYRSLFTLASLSILPALQGATDAKLVDLLVANGTITRDQAANIEVSHGAGTDPALIALLVSSGALTSAQANQLTATRPEPSAPAAAAAPAAGSSSMVVKAKEKAVQALTISGRVHAQLDVLNTDYDNVDSPDDEVNLFLRRIYLGAEAQFAEGLTGIINTNFGNTGGTGEIEKAIVSIDLGDFHSLDVGYQKVPFGYEETTSSSKIPAVERSIATRYFTEQLDYGARHSGIYFNGNYDSGVAFTLALTNPTQGSVAESSSSDQIAAWGRASWSGKAGDTSLEFGLNGGIIPDQRTDEVTDLVWGAFANVSFSDFKLGIEYLAGSLEDAAGSQNANPQGLNLTGAWKLNNTFELIARAAFLDADGGVGADISDTFRRAPENGSAKFDQAEAYYFGGNWYIRGNTLKLSAGYEWANFSDNLTGLQGDATVSGLRTRLQLLF